MRRAYALAGLGRVDEALMAHCVSVTLLSKSDGNSNPTIPSAVVQDIAKVSDFNRFLLIEN